jgi:hypothetical protein
MLVNITFIGFHLVLMVEYAYKELITNLVTFSFLFLTI